jgi:hypothetical protein
MMMHDLMYMMMHSRACRTSAIGQIEGKCDFPHAVSREAQIERIDAQIAQLRLIAQRCARDAASFIHPQLAVADITHDHCRKHGKLIRPVIEITGYPGPDKIAPTKRPALPPPDNKR